jgi:hypothetical protein
MEKHELKRKMSLPLGIFLIILVAIAGSVAFYMEYNLKERLLAEKEQIMVDQQNHVMAVYDQIESNLASIREHESMISQDLSGPENTTDMAPEVRIQNEINYIKNLIDENNKLIADLNGQISQKDARIAGYQKSVKDLQARMTTYQQQLDQLVAEKEALKKDLDNTTADRDNLATQVHQLGSEVETKNSELIARDQEIQDKELAMHTAYYRIGTYKTLRDQQILDKEGGVLGINGVYTLTADPDEELFQKIDTREVTRIPIDARRFEIVTDQAPASYKLDQADNVTEWLEITNPELFWSKSKYLVIVVRDNNYDQIASSR